MMGRQRYGKKNRQSAVARQAQAQAQAQAQTQPQAQAQTQAPTQAQPQLQQSHISRVPILTPPSSLLSSPSVSLSGGTGAALVTPYSALQPKPKPAMDAGGGANITSNSSTSHPFISELPPVLRIIDTNTAPFSQDAPAERGGSDVGSDGSPATADSETWIPSLSLARPAVGRQESKHEYEASGLDGTPRSPTRSHRARNQNRSPSQSTSLASSHRVSLDIEGSPPSKSSESEGTVMETGALRDAQVDGVGDRYDEEAFAAALHDNLERAKGDGKLDSAVEAAFAALQRNVGRGRHGLPRSPGLAAGDDVDERRDEEEAFGARGIHFAPWNVPFHRRLQMLAAVIHCLSIATTLSIFFFLCAIPLTWPLVIAYLLAMLQSKAATDGLLRSRSERFRRLPVWRLFADYFPARLHKTQDLLPTKKYIFGYHPHGIISHGAFAAFATEALGFSDKFPGITNSLLTLESNFRLPLYRDYILALGLNSVSKESIENLLSKGGSNGEGMGRAVTIVVGGARESLEAEPGTLRLVLRVRKGFVKMAVRMGADLVPVLAFGENDLYDQISPRSYPTLRRLQMWVLHTLKFTLPFLHGRGIFNYDVGLMPYRRPLNIVVGRPIPVRQQAHPVDMAEVDRLHRLYMEELQDIWDKHKNVFAEGRKGEMTIIM